MPTRFNRLAALLLIGAAIFAPSADAQTPESAKKITLVAMGDSLVAGFGLPQTEGFTPQLQAWLIENGASDVVVLNGGVSGDTTTGGLARIDWTVVPEADAVILELGGNDTLRGVDPSITRANIDKMLTRLNERDLPVLLAGMVAAKNWGPEDEKAFESIYPDMAKKHGVPLYPFFLQAVFDDASLFQPDRIHPNAEGVKKIVVDIGPMVLQLVEQARAKRAAK